MPRSGVVAMSRYSVSSFPRCVGTLARGWYRPPLSKVDRPLSAWISIGSQGGIPFGGRAPWLMSQRNLDLFKLGRSAGCSLTISPAGQAKLVFPSSSWYRMMVVGAPIVSFPTRRPYHVARTHQQRPVCQRAALTASVDFAELRDSIEDHSETWKSALRADLPGL